MTTSPGKTGPGAAPLPPVNRHLRLTQKAEVTPTEAGRFAVPLVLHEGTSKITPVQLVLTAEEAVTLHILLSSLPAITGGSTP